MTFESDYLVDRRRLKRRLTFWRIVAVIAVVATVAAAFGRFGGSLAERDFIARIEIEGVIVNDGKRLETIAKLADNESVKAVILRIDSPGGTVVGGETLHNALLELNRKKPLVVVMDGIATSAAYMAAIAADHIVAREGTLTGSVGVILQTTEITKLLEMVGVSARSFKSGQLKAVPSPLEPITPDVEKATQGLVAELYRMFRDMVLRRRGMNAADAKIFADGRVFTGRQALKAGLIDQIGGEPEAVAWLEKERDIPEGLRIRKVKLRPDVGRLFGQIDSLARKTILSERLTLDGLISVWHPQLR